MEKLYTKRSAEDHKQDALSEEEAEMEDYVRKRLEGSDLSTYEEESKPIPSKKENKKEKLSTMDKALIISAIKSRRRTRMIRRR